MSNDDYTRAHEQFVREWGWDPTPFIEDIMKRGDYELVGGTSETREAVRALLAAPADEPPVIEGAIIPPKGVKTPGDYADPFTTIRNLERQLLRSNTVVAILIERLGGDVTITDEEHARWNGTVTTDYDLPTATLRLRTGS